jgi:hypothetical protein
MESQVLRAVRIKVNLKNLYVGLDSEADLESLRVRFTFFSAERGLNEFAKYVLKKQDKKYGERLWYLLVNKKN